jgi:hypothetical protein
MVDSAQEVMYTWLISLVVLVLYVHLFNAIASWYLDSNRTLEWKDLWAKFTPPVKITIQLT